MIHLDQRGLLLDLVDCVVGDWVGYLPFRGVNSRWLQEDERVGRRKRAKIAGVRLNSYTLGRICPTE
jgi:hypothetical protein